MPFSSPLACAILKGLRMSRFVPGSASSEEMPREVRTLMFQIFRVVMKNAREADLLQQWRRALPATEPLQAFAADVICQTYAEGYTFAWMHILPKEKRTQRDFEQMLGPSRGRPARVRESSEFAHTPATAAMTACLQELVAPRTDSEASAAPRTDAEASTDASAEAGSRKRPREASRPQRSPDGDAAAAVASTGGAGRSGAAATAAVDAEMREGEERFR